ncbi:N-acetylneuraminate synthase [Ulvibacterium sp.]|uniref:N-acetylneuraminate synthase n=1 Tax=Ulvibacterium sp. TaxID=2665914 RepID=UPI003CC5DF38
MKKTLIIAEAGVNHNGEIELAYQLVDAAVAAGADYVKFQTFKASKLASVKAEKAEYQKTNTKDSGESQFEMLKKLELTPGMHDDLIAYCKLKNIKFLSTGFDTESILYLNQLRMALFKIPSGEITNLPYLELVGSLGKPLILSTGMSTMAEVGEALEVLMSAGAKKSGITVLHCNTEYPTPMKDVNLRAMLSIANTFQVRFGYSDHTLGIEIPIAAAAMGATVIEKHFTLNRNMEGPDHLASLEPKELMQMVQSIRNVDVALGSSEKTPSKSEQKNLVIARKSIVANNPIKKGEVFTTKNLTVKRPGNGISPMRWRELIGTRAKKNYQPDDLI